MSGVSARRYRRRVFPIALGLGASVLGSASSPAGPARSIVDSLLREKMGFSASDLRTHDEGSAVIKTLETPVREELAFVAAVYFDAPPGAFVERFRDIVRFESGPGIPQIERFGSPPRLEDLGSLTLPRTDVAALRYCHPGDCEVKLSAERAPTDPKVFTRIHYHFVVRGRKLKPNLVEQAVRLTHEKYCSATAILGKTAEITKEFEVIEEA